MRLFFTIYQYYPAVFALEVHGEPVTGGIPQQIFQLLPIDINPVSDLNGIEIERHKFPCLAFAHGKIALGYLGNTDHLCCSAWLHFLFLLHLIADE